MNFTELEKHFSADFESLAALESQVLTPIFTHADSDVNYTPINQRIGLTETMKRTAQRSHISDVWQAGKYTLGDGEELQLLEVVLADDCNIMRSRVGIQSTIRQLRFDCALIVFRYQNSAGRRWRLSYVEKGNTQAQNTSAKRYTYLFGAGVGCRTAAERFTKLANTCDITKADLTAAFSVEALTKEFYHELFEWYLWAIDPQTGITFPNDTNIEEDDREDLETKVIRMITRIMFVWFIKQKQLVPERIFKVEYLQTILSNFDPQSTTQSSYYNAILQNLFFATLNRAIIDAQGNQRHFATANKRDIKTLYRYAEMFTIGQQEVIDLFAEVPFLNGGLFECLDKTRTIDGVERAYNFDGFSRNDRTFADGRYRNRAVVPNHLFFAHGRGLFDILARYNFTIEENTPEEQQVALDPELLGKVFENLLGAYNPETKETARNQSGSFYTPREIVNYMVDQSLIAYLGNTPFAQQLFAPNFEYDSQCQTQYTAAANKLKQIKILDPACGSGAFPMGLLNRMVEVLQRLQPDEDPYQQKLFIIQNCLYGSDIQCIAAQITKLRFFISLICDCQRTGTAADNYGIPVLPNLETKFVAANSLRSIKRGKNVQLNLFDTSEIENLKAELHNVRRKHFDATSASQKITLRQRDQELRQQLANIINQLNGTTSAETNFLLEWNPYDQNTSAPDRKSVV